MKAHNKCHIGRRVISLLCAALVFVLVGTSASASSTEINIPITDTGRKLVRVGWFDTSFNFKDSYGRRSGYAYDYQQKISSYVGWDYEYVEGSWTELFQMLEKGDLDLMADISYTDERKDKMFFSTRAMGSEVYALYINPYSKVIDPENLETLNGKRIAVTGGSVISHLLRDWESNNGIEASIVEFEGTAAEMVDMLWKGEVDAIVYMEGFQLVNKCLSIAEVGTSDFYFAVNRQRPDLIDDLNSAMTKIFRQNKHYNDELYETYINSRLNDKILSTEELQWLNKHGAIRIGYRDDYLSFCGLNKQTGKLEGALSFYLNFASHCFSNGELTFEAIPFNSTQEAIDALGRGDIDCLFPLNISNYDAEEQNFMLTEKLMTSETYAMVKSTGSSIGDQLEDSVAIVEGDPNYEAFARNSMPNYRRAYYKDVKECMHAVARGEVTCMMVSSYRLSSLEWLSAKYKLIGVPSGVFLDLKIMLRETDLELFSIINRSVCMVPEGMMNSELAAAVVKSSKLTLTEIIKENYLPVVTFLVTIVCLIIFLLVKSVSSERKMKEANEEVVQLNKFQEIQIEKITALNNTLEEYGRIMGCAGFGIGYFYYKEGHPIRLKMNRKMREILGLHDESLSEEEQYTYWQERCRDEAFEGVTANVNLMLDGKIAERTYQWYHPEKGIIYTRSSGSASRMDDGTMVISITHSDVTEFVMEEQKQKEMLESARKQAETANKAKSTFLFNMSHDLRTPMSAIIGYGDLMEKYWGDEEKITSYLKKQKDASQFMLSLINNVLEMARIESGKETLNLSAWNINTFLDSMESIINGSVQEKSLEFTRTVEVEHSDVMLDAVKLREVYLNVLSNAVKYTPSGGKIKMELKELPSDKPDTAVFRAIIQDTGIGMSQEFLPHLFDSFSREKSSTQSGVIGTGLGMPIAKSLVEIMGGTMIVESQLGKGTRFAITIPYKLVDRSMIQAEGKVQDPTGLESIKGKRILLVEDNELNVEIASTILEDVGFVVEHASNGQVALDMVSASEVNYYDLILMDVQMPVMDGYTATKKIRGLKNGNAYLPIVAMTANAFDEDKREAFSAGMNGHVSKPININALMKTLTGILVHKE